MILRLMFLAVLPGFIGYHLYPRLTSRSVAWLIAFAAFAGLAGFSAATVTFWWLPEGPAPAGWRLVVAAGFGALSGLVVIASFVGLFGGQNPVEPRPLNRIIATAVTTVAGYLLCEWFIDMQRGPG